MGSLPIVRIWAAAAWADGTLHATEAAALQRLIDASDDLDDDARREAYALLLEPPAEDLSHVGELPPESREGVYRAALRIVRLDRHVADEETAFLARLRGQLALAEAVIQRLEAELRVTP